MKADGVMGCAILWKKGAVSPLSEIISKAFIDEKG